jgi:hypothetical protein
VKLVDKLLAVGTGLMLLIVVTTLVARLSDRGGQLRPGDLIDGTIAVEGHWTLVLALSPNCKYCTDSMPFYREKLSDANDLSVVVVGLETADELRAYTRAHGLRVSNHRQIKPQQLRLRSTPTLLLVSPNRQLHTIWTGMLSQRGEEVLLASLSDLSRTKTESGGRE